MAEHPGHHASGAARRVGPDRQAHRTRTPDPEQPGSFIRSRVIGPEQEGPNAVGIDARAGVRIGLWRTHTDVIPSAHMYAPTMHQSRFAENHGEGVWEECGGGQGRHAP